MPSKPTERPRPPSVERVLAEIRRRAGEVARDPVMSVAAARLEIDAERSRLADGRAARPIGALADDVVARLEGYAAAGPLPVINATGVIVHTNLGRAPWPKEVARAVAELASSYLLLELDRETGRRGSRVRTAEEHLVALTGAEDALVTNNNAAALALAVGLAGRGGVVVSRGELVEIGGGVRIPEIIRRAGAPPHRGRDDQPNACRGLRGAAGRGQGPRRPARPSLELHDGRLHRGAGPGDGRRARPSPRGDRHRRPGLWSPARHGHVRPGPRADAVGTAGGRLGRRHVQRRQARRRPAGGTRRGAGRPGRPDAP